ncbi:MAG: hypothetical protein KAJ36_06905, partial [Candidatus Thorarchaeota archaeon]|nr:hypothetical protein [Candidatus Thorarchaeota archaeon]
MMDDIASRLKVVSVFIFLGFLMTLGMTVMTLLNPGGGNLYEVRAIGNVIADLIAASATDINIVLVGLVFDNFFIIGYLCIFYGLFLITKERDRVISMMGFALGLTTGFTDLIENALQVALLTGVPNGWVPADSVFSSLWIVMYVKDISSYMAGFVFIVMLLLSLNDRQEIRLSKLVFVILLGLYVSLGVIALVEPSFLIFRNLSFMIDMLIGSLLFRQMAAKL